MDGTQIAVVSVDGKAIIWRFPSCERVIKKKYSSWNDFQVAWNPFDRDLLAIYLADYGRGKEVSLKHI